MNTTGRMRARGTVRAQIKEIADGTLVNMIKFGGGICPSGDAIAINGVGGTAQNEIAVHSRAPNWLGDCEGSLGWVIKDLLTRDLVNQFP